MTNRAVKIVKDSVSRETFDRLGLYVGVLQKWNRRINLIGKSTTDDIWSRHILDSLQLSTLAPKSKRWIDLGSGGGFPGLVVAAAKAEDSDFDTMTLVESDHRKCAFMAAAAREMILDVNIVCCRIEDCTEQPCDIVSARALAPLNQLLLYAKPLLAPGGKCLFPKGKKAVQELTEAQKSFQMTWTSIPSATDSNAAIICVEEYDFV